MENGDVCAKLFLLLSVPLWLLPFTLQPRIEDGNSVSAAPYLGQNQPLFSLFMVAAGVAFHCSLAAVLLGHRLPASVFSFLLWTCVVSIAAAFPLLLTL